MTEATAQKLLTALYELERNVDVSTIRPGKRNSATWGTLKMQAKAAIGDAIAEGYDVR